MRIGIGGPVGSGKSSLIAALCRELSASARIGVVTNDIYTTEDAEFLRATGVLDAERIVAVQTGCCPHTAIRDDISTNLEAVADLERATGPLELVFVESGGDNLTAIFSPALADAQIFVIDVAGGDDIPRKGGPGIARSDLLVINKTDLAPFVGSDVELMVREATARREWRTTAGPRRRTTAAWAPWRAGCSSGWRSSARADGCARASPGSLRNTITTCIEPGIGAGRGLAAVCWPRGASRA